MIALVRLTTLDVIQPIRLDAIVLNTAYYVVVTLWVLVSVAPRRSRAAVSKVSVAPRGSRAEVGKVSVAPRRPRPVIAAL